MSYASMAADLVGGAMQAYGAMQQGSATASADNFNATIANQNAVAVQQQADHDVALLRRRAQQSIGRATAAYGASGIVTGSGSPLDVLSMSSANAELDAQTAQYKAGLKETGFADQAALDRLNAANAMTSAEFSAASALLNGVTGAASKYSNAGSSLSTQ